MTAGIGKQFFTKEGQRYPNMQLVRPERFAVGFALAVAACGNTSCVEGLRPDTKKDDDYDRVTATHVDVRNLLQDVTHCCRM